MLQCNGHFCVRAYYSCFHMSFLSLSFYTYLPYLYFYCYTVTLLQINGSKGKNVTAALTGCYKVFYF